MNEEEMIITFRAAWDLDWDCNDFEECATAKFGDHDIYAALTSEIPRADATSYWYVEVDNSASGSWTGSKGDLDPTECISAAREYFESIALALRETRTGPALVRLRGAINDVRDVLGLDVAENERAVLSDYLRHYLADLVPLLEREGLVVSRERVLAARADAVLISDKHRGPGALGSDFSLGVDESIDLLDAILEEASDGTCSVCGDIGLSEVCSWRDGWGDPRTRRDAIMTAPCPVCGAGEWGESLAPLEGALTGPLSMGTRQLGGGLVAHEYSGNSGTVVIDTCPTPQIADPTDAPGRRGVAVAFGLPGSNDAAAEASRRTIEHLNAMDPDERTELLLAQSVRAGIYTEEGELTERYGGVGFSTAAWLETTEGIAEIREEPDGTLSFVRMVDGEVDP